MEPLILKPRSSGFSTWIQEPKNHHFVDHPDIAGDNCAWCGKPKEGHKLDKEKETDKD